MQQGMKKQSGGGHGDYIQDSELLQDQLFGVDQASVPPMFMHMDCLFVLHTQGVPNPYYQAQH